MDVLDKNEGYGAGQSSGTSAVKWGVIAGLGAVVISLVGYLVSPKFFVTWASWLGFAAFIICMVKAAADDKEAMGGYMSWGQALKPTFLTYVIGSLISSIFVYVMFNFVDGSLVDVQKEIAVDTIEQLSGFLGEDGMEAAIDALDQQSFDMTMSTTLLGYAFGLILPGFPLAAIISAIMRKNRPDMV